MAAAPSRPHRLIAFALGALAALALVVAPTARAQIAP